MMNVSIRQGPRAIHRMSPFLSILTLLTFVFVVWDAAAATPAHAAAVRPTKGLTGTVSIAEGEPDHLIPGNSGTAFDEEHALFAPLDKINAKGKLVMIQAKSITSPDDRVWTIKIKPGWTFDNGESVTAQSYVNAWDATAYAPNAWYNNGELSEIQGYSALNPTSGKPTTSKLSGLQVISPTEFKVTLTAADSQFPIELSANQLGFEPMPSVAYQNFTAYDNDPIGDGPFEMVGSWKKNVSIEVKAYPGYKGSDKPKVKNILFKIYSNINTAFTDLEAGNLDITDVGADLYKQVKSQDPSHLIAYNAPAIDFLGIPLYNPQYQNIKLREALSMAINRQAINKAIFDGIYSPATAMTPPSEQGSPVNICPYCKYDPAKARQLLKEAGGWHGGPLVIFYPGGSGADQEFEAIGNEIRQNLGIKVTYQSPPFAQLFQTEEDGKTPGPNFGHWGALYPSMQNTLEALFSKGGGDMPATNYANPKVQQLIIEANSAPTLPKSEALYRQAEETAMKDFPLIPLFFDKYVYVYGNNVHHVTIDVNQIELTQLTVGSAK